MREIGIVGDLHISTKVSSRKDDYFMSMMEKIEEIASNCKNVIFLGDIFNTPTIPLENFSYFYSLLKRLQSEYQTKFHTIIGNHDVFNYLEETLPKTSLGLLNTLGMINIITPNNPLTIGKYTFHTTPLKQNLCKEYLRQKRYEENDVLLLHQYYLEFSGLEYEDLRNLNCRQIFLGHDHKPIEGGRIVYPEFTIYRSGSCGRNKADDYNLSRPIYYYIIEDEVTCQLINSKPANEVFTEQALTRENYHKKQFIKDINEVIQKYTQQTTNVFSIKQVLRELSIPTKCMEYLEVIYMKLNERFE